MRRMLLLALLLSAAPCAAQSPADTLNADSLTRTRLRGDMLRNLPIDSLEDALRFVPGFTATGTFRNLLTPPAIRLDGVPLRRLLPGSGVVPSLAVLQYMDVVASGARARTGDAAGGVLELRTEQPSADIAADARFATDRFAPSDWRTYQTRAEAQVRGAVPGVRGVRFLLAGEALGNRYTSLPQSSGDVPLYVATGVDSLFVLPRSTTTDSLTVAMPAFTEWDGAAAPLGNNDRTSLSAVLGYARSPSAGLDVSLHTTRRVSLSKPLAELYNPDAWQGNLDRSTVVSVTGHAAVGRLNTSAYISHQRYDDRSGDVDPTWAAGNAHPALGFSAAPRFFGDPDNFAVDAELAHATRTGSATPTSVLNEPGLVRRQGVMGISQALRLNPYGMRANWMSTGLGIAPVGFAWREERHLIAGAQAEFQLAGSSIVLGGEHDTGTLRGRDVTLLQNGAGAVVHNDPVRSALWMEGDLNFRALSLNAGVRVDRMDRGGIIERVPGVVTAPDTADSFRETEVRTALSPRISAHYRLGGRVVARAAMGRFHDMRPMFGMTHDRSRSGSTPGRYLGDPTPPRVDLVEAGFSAWVLPQVGVDITLYQARLVDAYAVVSSLIDDPQNGTSLRPVWTNTPTAVERRGVEVAAHAHVAAGLAAALTYGLEAGDEPVQRPHAATAILSFEPNATGILRDIGIYATASFRSGVPYTRLRNDARGTLSSDGLGPASVLAEQLNASRTPSERRFDVRAAKGFHVAGHTVSVSADLRNPLGLANTRAVYAETGTVDNEPYRSQRTQQVILAYLGTGVIEDTVIDTLAENDLNRYSLHQAERRFGNGDGVFSVAEQRRVADAYLDLTEGVRWRRSSDRMLRLGVELKW